MEKELVKKIIVALVIFFVVVGILIVIFSIYTSLISKEKIVMQDLGVGEFKANYRKIYEKELFKIYVYKNGLAEVFPTEKLKNELNDEKSVYYNKFESSKKKNEFLEKGLKVTFADKSIKVSKAFEYVIGENGEEVGIAFVLEGKEMALLLEDDIFKGEDLLAKKVQGVKNVEYFNNVKNFGKKSDSALNTRI